MAEFADLMTTEGLTENELIVKKSYVIVCSFDTSKTNHSYTELSEKLNVSVPAAFLFINLIFFPFL